MKKLIFSFFLYFIFFTAMHILPEYLHHGYFENTLKKVCYAAITTVIIIRGLQALTRNQTSGYARVNLHHLVWHIMALSRSELERRQIVLEYALKAEAAFIYGDSVQIQQVLLNLVMNAIDAMSDIHQRARVLTVSSENPTAGRIRLEIADTGIGLCPEVKARLFDSFYTTKAQGMGMGLTISYGIIEKHRGELTAACRQPYGSLFTFTLPTESDSEN